MKKQFKFKAIMYVLAAFLVIAFVSVKSNVHAASYIYDAYKNIIPSTEGVTYKETYYNKDIVSATDPSKHLEPFKNLTAMEVYNDKIYVLDQNPQSGDKVSVQLASGAVKSVNKSYIVVLNQDFKYEKVVSQFKITDAVKAKLDEFYKFTTPLDKITEEQYSSAEFVDVYNAETSTFKVHNGKAYFEAFAYNDAVSNVRGSSLEIYNNNSLIDDSTYTYDLVSEINFIDREDNPITLDDVLNALVVKNINVLYSKTEEVAEKEKETNEYGIQTEVTKIYNSVSVIISKADASAAEAAIKGIKAGTKTQFNVKDVTEVTFNGLAEDTEVLGIYKHIITPGRAPYIPYYDEETNTLDLDTASVVLNAAEGITLAEDPIYGTCMFVADTQNARILKIDSNFIVVDVYLTPEDTAFYQMYNATYQTEFGQAVEIISSTQSSFYTKTISSSSQVFYPKKVAVKNSGVVYCIATNIYEGLVEFGTNTKFNRFLGKNEVTANPLKQAWSKFFTETQLSSLAKDLPPMFNNITIGPNGFLYATSNPETDATTVSKMVKIISTKGGDTMKRNGYVTPDGDVVYIKTTNVNKVVLGPSVLTSVAVSESGNFTVTDQTRGRLFTYDSEGNLLYITGAQPGGLSSQGSGNGLSNSIINPVALDYLYRTLDDGSKEETLIVLDQGSSAILLFETTEFGKAVNQATYLYQNGVIADTYKTNPDGSYVLDENGNRIVESMGAESYWRQVIKMNTNYELAYLGIGKALNRRGEFKEALEYFKLAHDKTYYSKAFSSYRDQVLNQNFNLLMTAVMLLIFLYIMYKIYKRVQAKHQQEIMRGGKR